MIDLRIDMSVYKVFTDIELITAVKMGDSAAFAEIYDRYWDKLFI